MNKVSLGKKIVYFCLTFVFLLPSFHTSNAANASIEDRLIQTGMQYLGVPYEWGASTDQTLTFDCSSYTLRVFAENGITIPRTSVLQYELGTPVALEHAKKGNLVFFHNGQTGVPGHVGIYIGDMKMLSATVSKGTRVVDISTSYWMSRFIGVKDVLPQYHMVTDYDSLWKLSIRTGNSISELKAWNGLKSDMILTGLPLFISNPDLVQASRKRDYHVVTPKDSLWTISQQYGVTLEQLQQWNQIQNIHVIYDGTRIYLEN